MAWLHRDADGSFGVGERNRERERERQRQFFFFFEYPSSRTRRRLYVITVYRRSVPVGQQIRLVSVTQASYTADCRLKAKPFCSGALG